MNGRSPRRMETRERPLRAGSTGTPEACARSDFHRSFRFGNGLTTFYHIARAPFSPAYGVGRSSAILDSMISFRYA